jgi:cobalt-zinc-cadmium efflux system membrane fusion protein
VNGRVVAALASIGQPVKPGDILAKIDSPDYGQARADARKAVADLVLAERNLTRLRTLCEHGAAPKKDLEAAEDAQASALSEKERAIARLALYGGNEVAVDPMFSLKAPLGGLVVEKNLNPGQEVRPDQMLANAPQLFAPLFVISDPTRLWLLLDVTEKDIPTIRPGQAVNIYTTAYTNRAFAGTLEVMGDSLDPVKRTINVRGSVPNPDRLLKAEMYVTVDVLSDTPLGVTIPSKAVFHKDNKPYVFIEAAPGRYERRQVKTGPEDDGKTSILEGLQNGQRVVTEGNLLLQALLESGSGLSKS